MTTQQKIEFYLSKGFAAAGAEGLEAKITEKGLEILRNN